VSHQVEFMYVFIFYLKKKKKNLNCFLNLNLKVDFFFNSFEFYIFVTSDVRILNDEQAETILYQNMAKNKVLLIILVRRGPRAFSTFVKDPRLEEFEDLTDPLECD
jgi:hypothetical protein